ncbi:hypothetical protein HDU76_000604 [Blyttiomyces sp. JEL0837]|nr:hypothetical protein HDU76_000604 [Blyttiomyces sp. JEL0837]
MSTQPFVLRVANTLVYFFFLGSHLYSTFGPNHNSDYYNGHPTYLTPASWAFAVWSLIHFLFGGFVLWQWFPETEDIIVHAYGAWFALAGLLTSVQLALWNADQLILSLFVLLFASGAVSVIYYNLATSFPAQTPAQHLLVHAPISLYHAWLVFIFWLNLMAIFTSVQNPAEPDWFHCILVFVILLKLAATASGYTEWRHASGDVAGAGVIAWALFAVSAGQSSPFISWSAFILGWYVVIHALFRPAQFHWKKSQVATETEPLLGAQQA